MVHFGTAKEAHQKKFGEPSLGILQIRTMGLLTFG